MERHAPDQASAFAMFGRYAGERALAFPAAAEQVLRARPKDGPHTG